MLWDLQGDTTSVQLAVEAVWDMLLGGREEGSSAPRPLGLLLHSRLESWPAATFAVAVMAYGTHERGVVFSSTYAKAAHRRRLQLANTGNQ